MSLFNQSAPALDHILLAVPYKVLQNPPAWLTSNFTIQTGGTHSSKLTTNALISFKSGTYLELIAFTPFADEHPELKKSVLGNSSRNPIGWIHWVLQPDPEGKQIEVVGHRVKEKAESLVEKGVWPAAWAEKEWYLEAQEGSRDRPDGKRVEWQVNYPDPTVFPLGSIPFWCRDISPREWRVRGDDVVTTHPSGAVGVHEVRIAVAAEKYLESYAEAYTAIVGRQWKLVDGGAYEIDLEDPLDQHIRSKRPKVVIGLPKDEDERKRMADEQTMVAEVVFLVSGKDGVVNFQVNSEMEDEKITFGFRL